jgi:hypothetical protein
MTLEAGLRWVEAQLWHELQSNKLRKQVNRFVWSFLASLYASLAASHFHVTWTTLLAFIPPALWVGLEQAAPSIPWSKVHEYLHAAAQPPIVPPLPVEPQQAATAPQAGSPAAAAPAAESQPADLTTPTEGH